MPTLAECLTVLRAIVQDGPFTNQNQCFWCDTTREQCFASGHALACTFEAVQVVLADSSDHDTVLDQFGYQPPS